MNGRFKKGDDPRRHSFSKDECSLGGRKGFQTIMNEKPYLLLWLRKKLRKQGKYSVGTSDSF